LTLGGYDASRFASNEVTFAMYEDVARRFIVNLDSIVDSSNTGLQDTAISVYIDSTIPFMYLPVDICKAFEVTYGLIWNATSQIYMFNNTTRTENTNLTFSISNTANQKVNITLPFSAFNLTASYPLVTSSTSYFPLRPAMNQTQYTLGRVFLQEA